MTVKASEFLNEFTTAIDGYISFYDKLLTELDDFELTEVYSDDFIADGDESFGEIYYYYESELAVTCTVHYTNRDFKFTELGKTMFKELLFNYITLLLNK